MTPLVVPDYQGLTCYTANLAAYLDGEFDGRALLANSVHMAVRVDLPEPRLAFSHHRVPLNRLPDGSSLRYRAARDVESALAGVEAQVHRHGRCIVLVDNSRLPWSPAHDSGRAAPHWLLVDGLGAAGWHVRDEFTGLLPEGEQTAFTGWMSADELARAMAAQEWTAEQRTRNDLACGFPLEWTGMPGRAWLERTREPVRPPAPLPGRWAVGYRTALPVLADRLTRSTEAVTLHLDDCWALTGHRRFALRHRWAAVDPEDHVRIGLEHAAQRWAALPRALRFAAESAQRGRPRPRVVEQVFAGVIAAEHVVAAQLEAPESSGGNRP